MTPEKYNQIHVYQTILKKWNKAASDRTTAQILLSATGLSRKELAEIRGLLIKNCS